MQLSKQELLEDNEELIQLLGEVCEWAEEQGCILPEELTERIGEFLVLQEVDPDVIDIKPS
jgi:hypothetical protein